MQPITPCLLAAFGACLLGAWPVAEGKKQAESLQLTGSSFDKAVFQSEKTTFVKFSEPWCQYCKKIAPHWEKLAAYYEGSPNVVIASVDCTDEKDLCKKSKINTYPSLKFFKPAASQEQKLLASNMTGNSDFEALKSFVKTKLKGKIRICDVSTKKDCTEGEVKMLEELQGKGKEELEAKLKQVKDKLKNEILKTEQREETERVVGMLKLLLKSKKQDEL
eukprot:TRINITY_DN8262_c0_g1_i1.p1 TRINITY_DN8262_c0_g1~~TRINITY_DN8262_c0_g1_i1.p1  ORF type:complete len:220 (+),score=95.22 TRINITY_DN8262_c0_g1_i1:70-729(+)